MAWSSPVSSPLLTCDANFEAFTDSAATPAARIIQLNTREICTITMSIASEVGETDNLEWQILGGSRLINGSATGTITSDTIIDVASGDNESNDYYMGMYFLMTSGGEVADVREIADYVSSTDALTLVRALSGTPTLGETYAIFHMGIVDSGIITAETTLTEDLPQNVVTAISGYPFVIVRARSTGATDAHIALMTYSLDGLIVDPLLRKGVNA